MHNQKLQCRFVLSRLPYVPQRQKHIRPEYQSDDETYVKETDIRKKKKMGE